MISTILLSFVFASENFLKGQSRNLLARKNMNQVAAFRPSSDVLAANSISCFLSAETAHRPTAGREKSLLKVVPVGMISGGPASGENEEMERRLTSGALSGKIERAEFG